MLHDITRIVIFWKMMENQIFTSRNMHGSNFRAYYCFSVVVCYFETALKNLENWHQTGAPVSHLSPNILQNFKNFSVKL